MSVVRNMYTEGCPLVQLELGQLFELRPDLSSDEPRRVGEALALWLRVPFDPKENPRDDILAWERLLEQRQRRFLGEHMVNQNSAHEIVELIDQLRETEASVVSISSDNADFNENANCLVYVVADWTDFKERRFTGDTLVEALRAARLYKESHHGGK